MSCLTQKTSKSRQKIRDLFITAGILVLGTLIDLSFLHSEIGYSDFVLIYVLCVAIISATTASYFFGILSGILVIFLYNYFFTIPYYSFSVYQYTDVIALITLVVVSCLISAIMGHAKKSALDARTKEAETQTLYQFTSELANCSDTEEAVEVTLENLSKTFDCQADIILIDDNQKPEQFYTRMDTKGVITRIPTNKLDFSDYKDLDDVKPYLEVKGKWEWPITGQKRILGVIGIPENVAQNFTEDEKSLLKTMAEAGSMVIDRQIYAKEKEKMDQQVANERYRSNFLRSVSHDLRTPLSGIIGTSEILINLSEPGTEINDLSRNIHKESRWLFELIQNILTVTQLQDGHLMISTHPEVVEEIIDNAAETIRLRYPDRKVITDYPDDILMAKVDPKLVKQALINLMDNANKHSPKTGVITVRLRRDGSNVCMDVMDEGTGISDEAKDKLFDMFYTTHRNDLGNLKGFGLGLPICDTIMKCLGGSITAGNRTDGHQGAAFTLILPEYIPDLRSEQLD